MKLKTKITWEFKRELYWCLLSDEATFSVLNQQIDTEVFSNYLVRSQVLFIKLQTTFFPTRYFVMDFFFSACIHSWMPSGPGKMKYKYLIIWLIIDLLMHLQDLFILNINSLQDKTNVKAPLPPFKVKIADMWSFLCIIVFHVDFEL